MLISVSVAPTALAQRCANLRAASARWPRSRAQLASRCSMSSLRPPSPRSPINTAMRAASKPWPRCAAVTNMFACSGAIGSAAKRSPWGVTRPVSSIAVIARNRPCASVTAAAGGGSRQGRLAGSGTPQRAQSSTNPARSASIISGGSKGTRPSVSAASHSRIATPGAVRPARPARWVTAA